jgi:predicted ATPase
VQFEPRIDIDMPRGPRRLQRSETPQSKASSLLVLSGRFAHNSSQLLSQAIAGYAPEVHRAQAMRFGQDVGVAILTRRSFALWALGYPDAATANIAQALRYARETGQAATSMYLFGATSEVSLYCGDYAAATALIDELVALADEKSSLFWRAHGMLMRGRALALTGKAADAVQMITSGFIAYRSTGAKLLLPSLLSCLATAHSQLGQFDAARQCIVEAMTTIEATKQRWCEADVHRMAGEIALMSPKGMWRKRKPIFGMRSQLRARSRHAFREPLGSQVHFLAPTVQRHWQQEQ